MTVTHLSREYAESKAKGGEGARLNFTTQDVLDNNIIIEAYFRDMYVQEISMVPDYDFWSLLGKFSDPKTYMMRFYITEILKVSTTAVLTAVVETFKKLTI